MNTQPFLAQTARNRPRLYQSKSCYKPHISSPHTHALALTITQNHTSTLPVLSPQISRFSLRISPQTKKAIYSTACEHVLCN
jgi:hypothetical protein